MADNDLTRNLDRLGRALDARAARRVAREVSRRERRESRRDNRPSYAGGAVMLVIALVLAVMGIVTPDKFWLLFVALGLGLGGAKQIEQARRNDSGGREKQAKVLPEVIRGDALCDQLLLELKDSPEAVREFLGAPEKTVEAIRSACRLLDERHAVMLEAISPTQRADLEQERIQLG